jgi:hypothetical protein
MKPRIDEPMAKLRIGVLALVALVLFARPLEPDELLSRWNKFATAGNQYVELLNKGVKDTKLRARLMKDWESLTRCECW